MSTEQENKKQEKPSLLTRLTTFDGVSIRGRVIIGIHIFTSWAILYMQRTCFNVIVAQVVSINGPVEGKFTWSQVQKSTALMSFYGGYWVAQVPGGALGERYGLRGFLSLSLLLASIFTIITPVAMRHSGWAAVGVRVVMGIMQGIYPPCFLVVMANWYPENCRSSAIGLSFPGSYIGTMLAMSIPSTIAQNQSLWPLSFYIFGGLGLLWVISFNIFYTESAKDNMWTKDDEKKFICDNIQRKQFSNLKNFPFKAALKSKPLWAIACSHTVSSWSLNIVIALMPSLIADLYYIEVKNQRYITFICPILIWTGAVVASTLYDYIHSKNICKKITIRKCINAAALLPTGLFFMFSSLIPREKNYIGIIFLLIASFFCGADVSISMPNIGDIAPQYSGILFGVVNTIATYGAIGTIQMAYSIVTDQHRVYEWQIVFGLMIFVQFFGFCIYTRYASGTIQSWAIQKDDPSEIEA